VFSKGGFMVRVQRSLWVLSIMLFAFSLLSFSACRRGIVKDDELDDLATEQEMREEAMKRLDEEGITEEELEAARRKVAELSAQEGMNLSNVYFDFDDFSLDQEAKTALAQNAAWLINNPQREIIIEGHCDERGTDEYNIALGERRANSTKRYLIVLGVNGAQLSTISFGEERPANTGHDESAWSQNRRAEFVIQ
jgi:peptidoglycan-associated lipoprotein